MTKKWRHSEIQKIAHGHCKDALEILGYRRTKLAIELNCNVKHDISFILASLLKEDSSFKSKIILRNPGQKCQPRPFHVMHARPSFRSLAFQFIRLIRNFVHTVDAQAVQNLPTFFFASLCLSLSVYFVCFPVNLLIYRSCFHLLEAI